MKGRPDSIYYIGTKYNTDRYTFIDAYYTNFCRIKLLFEDHEEDKVVIVEFSFSPQINNHGDVSFKKDKIVERDRMLGE